MDAEISNLSVVDQAWQRFATGDLDAAIALVRPMVEASEPSDAGCAALGFFLVQAGQFDAAGGVLATAFERFPHFAPVQWYLGHLAHRRGDLASAIDWLQSALKLDGSLDEAAQALAWVLYARGRTPDALGWALRALAARRTPARLAQTGWLQQELGNFEEAIALYHEAIAQFDRMASAPAEEFARVYLHLAQCLAHQGQVAQALAEIDRALVRWPRDEALLMLAVEQGRASGQPSEALARARALVCQRGDSADAWHLMGVVQQEAGDLAGADAALERAQELDPALTDAIFRRAQLQRDWAHFDGARWLLGIVLFHEPDHAPAKDLMAQVLLDLGETAAARRLLLERLRSRQHAPDLRRLLAVAQQRRGRVRAAWRSIGTVLKHEPSNVEALRMYGWLALELNDIPQAVEAIGRLLALVPTDIAARTQAAFVFARAGQLADAQRWAELAVAQSPDFPQAWRALSEVRLAQKRLLDAEQAVRRALHLAPDRADDLRHLGWVLTAANRHGEAQLAFLRAVDCAPGDPVPRLELAQAQARAGHFDLGREGIEALLRARPTWRPAQLARAKLLVDGGFDGAAQACAQLLRADRFAPDTVKLVLRLVALDEPQARALLRLVPTEVLRALWRDAVVEAVRSRGSEELARLVRAAQEDMDEEPWMATAALYVATLSERSQPQALAWQARGWFRALKLRHGLARFEQATRPGPADHRPRIAYVVSQLHQPLLERVLAAHSADRAHLFVYTNHPFKGLPAHAQLHPLVIETLAESCVANRIDIVIDTGGLHPVEGQFELLKLYARCLAPVQVGWLGCSASAGGLFDALLTDEVAVPPTDDPHYDETVLRLHGGQWSWNPPLAAPQPVPPPVLSCGRVTYGVTARSLKLGPSCLDSFARVVAATPSSQIRFIGEVASNWPLRREILFRMQARGVDAGRVFFDPFMAGTAYLAWFQKIDLVLDSFPGNGGLSLMDPLWMGVPVVTLAGAWVGARQGASVLHALGLGGWVADTTQRFCALATALAQDRQGLTRQRETLRARMQGSGLLDGRRVASQIEDFCDQLKTRADEINAQQGPKARIKAQARIALDHWLALPGTIDMPQQASSDVPDLSVVVVLYKQAGLSRRTLQALADQRGVTFETIVVDNASDDRTDELLDRLRGAKIIRNADNVGFLLAAQQGAAAARGRYIAFLNSDAVLLDGALAAAVRAMDADPGIGALGGRVVLTDGGLQEAGNTVFCDGSAGGIGRGEDPFDHAAMAARTTDYVSGVFLVTPTPLWHMLGGFDEVFAPAYYEDTDYCLRVWRAGLRVVYEPSVLLEHLEWGSATGNSATQLMERNRATFAQRHAAWLAQQPRPQALPLNGDRWRSPEDAVRRPRVLILDNEVPHMFKGGGLPRARLMLQALSDWPVTLFPLWTLHDDWRAVYGSVPKTIEVALGHGLAGLEGFLEQRRGVYDLLVVSRPPNLQAIAALRQRRPELFAEMRLVYDAEALFALREIAMAGVQGRPYSRDAARARLAAEIALACGASDVMVVSERDAGYFEAAGHRTHILSHGVQVRRSAPGLLGRSGLLFVGALHPGTPNEDGLVWFIEQVMPLLRERLPFTPVLSVVGVCLSDRVMALAGPEVKILGPQPDLAPHYDAARVFVAPVRFAGGVPAKVIEAAADGVPTVASALLVRQLGWRDGLDVIGARDAATFAASVATLLVDDEAWARQQLGAWEQCARRYDIDLFGLTLRRVLGVSYEGGAS